MKDWMRRFKRVNNAAISVGATAYIPLSFRRIQREDHGGRTGSSAVAGLRNRPLHMVLFVNGGR